ncbi:MAG TPA: YdcH family protein [Pyrinomonadaceae bacterium]
METARSDDSLKEELMNSNPEFRELVREHGRYEERLSQLSALSYPSDEEQLEEITLKKKKLAIKDQIYSMMLQHQKGEVSSH